MIIKVDNKTTIVFDLDDTLYNEIDYLKSAFNQISLQLDPGNNAKLYAKMFSLYRDGKNVFDYLIGNYNKSLDYLLNIYRNHIPEIIPFDNVTNVLDAIKAKGGNLAVITDGRTITQTNKLKSLGIFDCFDKIVISEDLGTEKPSINNYLAVENSFDSDNYWYFGDNFKKDFITPKKNGWKTVGLIDNGLNIHKTNHFYFRKENLPDFMIKSFKDIRIT